MASNTEKVSLISKDSSLSIKGLLMLLIVFGHTGMLTTNFETGERTFFWYWLYSFHVYVFFILPFIYGYVKNSASSTTSNLLEKCIEIQPIINDLKKNVVKIGVPYFWFFFFSAFVFNAIEGGFDFMGIIYAFVFGNEPLMDKFIGFNFVWFLPAMLALLTLKSIYYNSNRFMQRCIVLISVTLWVLQVSNILVQYTVGMYVPFAISQAFYFIIYGLMTRWLIEQQIVSKKHLSVFVLLVVIFTILLWHRKDLSFPFFNMTFTVKLVMPILIFLILYFSQDVLIKSKFLKFVGRQSLQIYLVHVYVINILNVIVLHFTDQSLMWGILIYILTIMISIVLSHCMMKIPLFSKIVFPNRIQ